jgi:hypothetical protein
MVLIFCSPLVELREQLVQQRHRRLRRTVLGMRGEVDDVGEQDRHLRGGIGDESLPLLQPLGDRLGQDVPQEPLRPRPLHLQQPMLASQPATAVDRVAEQQDRQPQRRLPHQLTKHGQHRNLVHEQQDDNRPDHEPGGHQQRPPQMIVSVPATATATANPASTTQAGTRATRRRGDPVRGPGSGAHRTRRLVGRWMRMRVIAAVRPAARAVGAAP